MPSPALEQVLKERVGVLVGEDLADVEEQIRRQLDSPVALIQEMGGYIAGAGGKRLRPMLLLLAARLAGYRGPRSVHLACVVELLHTATLIHDDVVDEAPLRRGRPSVNAQWGDDASVLVGDHLYSKSFAMLVRDNDGAIMDALARATVSMTEAEVFQLERKRSGVITETDYLRIITQKTASFISAGPVAQFSPITSGWKLSSTASAASISEPSSMVPVVSTVTWTIKGTSRPAYASARLAPSVAALVCSKSCDVSINTASMPPAMRPSTWCC